MNLPLAMRRRHRGWRLLILISVFVVGYIGILITALVFDSRSDTEEYAGFKSRHLLADNSSSSDDGFQYPPDAFTLEQRRNGAVVLHVIGLIYMFVALAIVCDEFFVPSLSVIIEKLKISEDVAGATFMAAGGSAPELFTSLIGVFFARNNVGIGTIVGSAVFNILFVIGMCAIFSKTVLDLTWWPLFRDVSFYSISLIVLIVFFRGGEIVWWQALTLLTLYILYVLFMKFNSQIENFVKLKILRRKARVHSDNDLITEVVRCPHNFSENRHIICISKVNMKEIAAKRPMLCWCQNGKPGRSCSIPILHSGTNHFRHGVLQLMIHTIDPISEGQVQDKAMQLHQVASLSLLNGGGSNESLMNNSNSNSTATPNYNGNVHNGHAHADKRKKQMHVHAISNGFSGVSENNLDSQSSSSRIVSPVKSSCSPVAEERIKMQSSSTRSSNNTDTTMIVDTPDSVSQDVESNNANNNEEPGFSDGDKPLDLSWPDTWRERLTYVLLAPLIFPLWLMLPDTRKEEKKKYFMVTFFGSIFWIFIFSYLMVWWANQTGETIGIPSAVMGLTILAAGTSIPDLITSVIVAKKGFGDMAVSSSVGSNIFDITVGLPVPWLLYAAIYKGKAINVNSVGLSCSILLLFMMLVTVVVVIAVSKWKMTKTMGGAMIVLYCVFLVLSVLLELEKIPCMV